MILIPGMGGEDEPEPEMEQPWDPARIREDEVTRSRDGIMLLDMAGQAKGAAGVTYTQEGGEVRVMHIVA